MPALSAEPRGDFVDGEFVQPEAAGHSWTNYSPADLSDCVGDFSENPEGVKAAIESARGALAAWSSLRLEDRISHLRRYAESVKKHKDELALTISRETGKPLWETRTEVAAVIAKVELTVTEGLPLVRDFAPVGADGASIGEAIHRPLGVVAILGPFNFPAHMPNGHFVPALLMGNTVILKPSEKTPLVGQQIAELADEAGLPRGVFSLVQGGAAIGSGLAQSDDVDAVLFTGSLDTGLSIMGANSRSPSKLLALEMGGKNPIIATASAPLKRTVVETTYSAYLTSGQRCTSASIAYVHESLADELVGELTALASRLRVGHYREDVFMGPLIDRQAAERTFAVYQQALADGGQAVLSPARVKVRVEGHYVSPSVIDATSVPVDASVLNDEYFCPLLAIVRYRDLEEVLERIQTNRYGLALAVFTKSEREFAEVRSRVKYGIVNRNKRTVGASGRLPFGGTKCSGNHRPSGILAVRYCSYTTSTLRQDRDVSEDEMEQLERLATDK